LVRYIGRAKTGVGQLAAAVLAKRKA
jgi:hypothetical protein